jgi:glycosyltransferase 2 family protein
MINGKKKYIGWLISAAFLTLVFSKVEWRGFIDSLKLLNLFDPIILALIYLFGFMLRGIRSMILLPGIGWREGFGGVFIGYAANNVLPARLGEVVRAHVVGKSAGISRTTTFSSVLVERIFDGSAIVLLLILGTQSLTLPEWADEVRIAGLLLFSIALACVLLIGFFHAKVSILIERYLKHAKLSKALIGLSQGVALAVRDLKTLVLVMISSVAIWLVESCMFLYGFYAFGFDYDLSAAMFVMAIVNLGVLIPSSPGGLGVFQYFAVLALEFLHCKHDPATAYALVVHFAQYVPVTLIGLLWLPRFGIKNLSVKELEQEQ